MISDDLIDKYLATLLGNSDPGDTMHQLVIAAAKATDCNALGLIPPDKINLTVYAIANDETVNPENFVGTVIMSAMVETRAAGKLAYFAGLAIEAHAVKDDGNEVTENLSRRLQADRKLEEHPAAIEVTRMYAACRDGRRWTGEHQLTGPNAGTVNGPKLRVGPVVHGWETALTQRLVRAAVGLVGPLSR